MAVKYQRYLTRWTICLVVIRTNLPKAAAEKLIEDLRLIYFVVGVGSCSEAQVALHFLD